MIGLLSNWRWGLGAAALLAIVGLWASLRSAQADVAALQAKVTEAEQARDAARAALADGAARAEALTAALAAAQAAAADALARRDEARTALALWADGLRGRIDDTIKRDGACALGPARQRLWNDALAGP